MKWPLKPARPDKVTPARSPAVQAVLDAWRGKDWLWCGEEEMAALAVDACRSVRNAGEILPLREVPGEPGALTG